MLRFELSSGQGTVRCYATDIRVVTETTAGQTAMQLHAQAGGNRFTVKETADSVEKRLKEALLAESALYAAAYQSRATLDALLTTLRSQMEGGLQKLVTKHLAEQLAPAVDAHMRQTMMEREDPLSDSSTGVPAEAGT